MTNHHRDDLDDLLTDAIAHRTASIEPASPDFETVLARHRRHARRVGTVAAVAVVAVGGVGVAAVASSSDSAPASDAHSAPATESTSPSTTVAESTTTIKDVPATTSSSTAPPSSEPVPPATYVLQFGDYPFGVANRHCMTGDELLEMNGWTGFAEFPAAGAAILVSSAPCPNPIIDYVITDGDSPETVAAKFCMSVDELAAVNDVHDLDVYFRPDSRTGFDGQSIIRVRDGFCDT